MKHLKLEVLETEWGKLIRVAEQTHRGMEFGEDWESFEYEGFRIFSASYPEVREDGLHVRGNDKTKDYLVSLVPSEEWLSKCRRAVGAYNKYFSDKPKKKEVKGKVVEVIE